MNNSINLSLIFGTFYRRLNRNFCYQNDLSFTLTYWPTPGDINCAQIIEESMFAPDPSSWYAIHGRVQERKQAIGFEVAPESGKQ